jgi:HNH endonuclease
MSARPLAERLWPRIDASGPCWLWTGCVNNHGYGVIRDNYQLTLTHRLVYEMLVGRIPEGMTLDHLCRVRRCCNPDHLDVVTLQENWRRSPWFQPTHCRKGHELMNNNRHGKCRTCITLSGRR